MSITIPWLTIVRRADPDRDRDLVREPQYEFSRDRTFRADGRKTGVYSPGAPEWIETPEIVGPAVVGAVIRCDVQPNMYTGAPQPAVTYQWQANGADMPGEDSEFLTLLVSDAGASITCVATLTNASGTDTTTTAPVVPVAA